MTNILVKSEPGFSPALDAEIVGTANDYIHRDPSGKHMRLNAHGVVKYVFCHSACELRRLKASAGRDKTTGALVYINYQGVVNITPELGAILGGNPDAKSTEFGDSCKVVLPLSCSATSCYVSAKGRKLSSLLLIPQNTVIEMRFETGEEKLKELELGVFVGAGRFIVERDRPVVVEYKLSKLVKGSA